MYVRQKFLGCMGRWQGSLDAKRKGDPSQKNFSPRTQTTHTQSFAGQHRLGLALVPTITAIPCAIAYAFACKRSLRSTMFRIVAAYHSLFVLVLTPSAFSVLAIVS